MLRSRRGLDSIRWYLESFPKTGDKSSLALRKPTKKQSVLKKASKISPPYPRVEMEDAEVGKGCGRQLQLQLNCNKIQKRSVSRPDTFGYKTFSPASRNSKPSLAPAPTQSIRNASNHKKRTPGPRGCEDPATVNRTVGSRAEQVAIGPSISRCFSLTETRLVATSPALEPRPGSNHPSEKKSQPDDFHTDTAG